MTKQQISESDCWFVIGAHQAGATERQCAELSGLPKTTAHNIIRDFKKLGSPKAASLNMATIMNPRLKKRKAATSTLQPRKRGRPRKPVTIESVTEPLARQVLKSRYELHESTKCKSDAPCEISDILPHDMPPTPKSLDSDDDVEEDWTLNDDQILLHHVLELPPPVKWKEIETLFGSRHMAKMCCERWEFLRKRLLKDMDRFTSMERS
ncbi:hypothetical protein EC973_003159 [Apophysomyces ossiformis]|uniref:Myb-like domain-containing protein n=1 Tax=Apophysomyces ossiformis TaxID=679940 RepID=A0A8H7EN74_9FUNG|nr:hypothetical protein EC973_003159 [Apophysomyces ossiformis]